MKKKLMAVLACALLLIGLAGCSTKQDSAEVANPMTEVTYEELREKTGIELPAPSGASNVKYYTIQISNDEVIAEMDFTLDGKDACLRAEVTALTDMSNYVNDFVSGKNKPEDIIDSGYDISGLNYEWESYAVQDVQGRVALTVRKGDIGFITWVDGTTGILYNLSMTKGADDQVLTDLANQVFVPMQGDVG